MEKLVFMGLCTLRAERLGERLKTVFGPHVAPIVPDPEESANLYDTPFTCAMFLYPPTVAVGRGVSRIALPKTLSLCHCSKVPLFRNVGNDREMNCCREICESLETT